MRSTFQQRGLLWVVTIFVLFGAALWIHGGIHLKEALLLLVICFGCELVDSGLGMGYGTIVTPTMLLLGYSPQDIIPAVLFSEVVSGFAAARFHHEIKNIDLRWTGKDLRAAMILSGGSIAGVTAGVFLAVSVSREVLSLLIGFIILTSGSFVLVFSGKLISYSHRKMVVLATVASFNKAVSGGGYGPLVTSGQILTGVHGKASVGITSLAEAFTCLVGLGLFLAKGGHLNMAIMIPMLTGALLSVPLAVFAIHKSTETHLKIVIGILTVTMGILTIYRALT